jgi:hypothetical protein
MMAPDEKFDAIIRSAIILAQARMGNWETAAHQVNDLGTAHGGAGIQILCMGLADTVVIQQGGFTNGEDEVVAPLWVDEDGNAGDADSVTRPEIRWAGRFLAARAAGDTDACKALWESASQDQFTANVFAMLEVAATTLNAVGAPL